MSEMVQLPAQILEWQMYKTASIALCAISIDVFLYLNLQSLTVLSHSHAFSHSLFLQTELCKKLCPVTWPGLSALSPNLARWKGLSFSWCRCYWMAI